MGIFTPRKSYEIESLKRALRCVSLLNKELQRDSHSAQVREFHETYNCPIAPNNCADDFSLATQKMRDTRIALLGEEWQEYLAAEMADNIVEIADALTDMLYIIHGTAISYGIPIDECFAEVHRSNMSKLEDCDCTKVNFIDYCMHCKNERKVPIYREDGKVLKGSHYSPPQLSAILFPLVES